MTDRQKPITVIGLIASLIAIFGFMTGIFSIKQLVGIRSEGYGQSTPPNVKIENQSKENVPDTPREKTPFKADRPSEAFDLDVLIAKIVVTLLLPIWSAVVFWKIADSRSWEIYYDPWPKITTALIYITLSGLCIAGLFPQSASVAVFVLKMLAVRVALTLVVPVLCAVLFWKIAYSKSWEIFYEPWPQIITGFIYIALSAACTATLFPQFANVSAFALRILTTFMLPLALAALSWKIADSRNWNIRYAPWPQVATGLIYVIIGAACLAWFFPHFWPSQLIWKLLIG